MADPSKDKTVERPKTARRKTMTGLEIIGVVALTWWTIQIIVPGL